MATLSQIPVWQVLDDNGVPLAGALLYTYNAGSSDPKPTYTDANSSIVAEWPLVFDAAGRQSIWLGTGLYKMSLHDSMDNEIWTKDDIGGGIGGGSGLSIVVDTILGSSDSLKSLDAGSALFVTCLGRTDIADGGQGQFYWNAASTSTGDDGITVVPSSAPSSGRWIRLFSGDVNPQWLGATGLGVSSDTAAFTASNTYAAANGLGIIVPAGTYLLSTKPTLTVPVTLSPEALLSWSGYNLIIQPVITDLNQHFVLASSADYPVLPMGSVIRPEWFGAKVNGSDDDTVPLQAAVLSLGYGGKLLLDGTSMIGDTEATNGILSLQNSVEIAGSGPSSVLQVIAGAGNVTGVLGSAAEVNNNYLHDFSILGDTTGSAIDLAANNIRLQNLEIINNSSGIELSGSNADIVNCDISANSIGLQLTSQTGANVRNNTIDTTGYGIYLSSATGILIDGNKFSGGGVNSVVEDTGVDATYGINFNDSPMVLETTRFIDVGDSLYVEINGDSTFSNSVEIHDTLQIGDSTTAGNLYLDSSTYITGDTTSYGALLKVKGDASIVQNLQVDGTCNFNYINSLVMNSLAVNNITRQDTSTNPNATNIVFNNGINVDIPHVYSAVPAPVYSIFTVGAAAESLQLCSVDCTIVGFHSGIPPYIPNSVCTIPANSIVVSSQINNLSDLTYFGNNYLSISTYPGGTIPGGPGTSIGRYGNIIVTNKNSKVSCLCGTPNIVDVTPSEGQPDGTNEWYLGDRSSQDVYIVPTDAPGGTYTGNWYWDGTLRIKINYWHLNDLVNV